MLPNESGVVYYAPHAANELPRPPISHRSADPTGVGLDSPSPSPERSEPSTEQQPASSQQDASSSGLSASQPELRLYQPQPVSPRSFTKESRGSTQTAREYLDEVSRFVRTTRPIIGMDAPNGTKSATERPAENGSKVDETEEQYTALDRVVCVDEFQWIASKKLPPATYDYFVGGADEEHTLRWNRSMITERYCLRPRALCDVSRVDLTKYIYGDRLAMPIGLSPTSMHKMAHPEGEKATVRACSRANTLMCLSLFATTSLEEVAKEAPICVKWQNLYILKDRELTQNVIARAVRYGYRAIVVTCDAPVLGNRRHNTKNQFTLGEHKLANIEDSRVKSMNDHSSELFDPSVTWLDLAELKKSVGDTIRVIAKGIMTPEDAEQALQAGVDGIWVSNHGGRQLDGSLSTIEALPAIVRAVNRRCPVFVDSGFRTGTDVLKALALGADMVFVGRTALWGLASYGEDGVHRALEIMKEELRRAMMLCGCNKLSDINRNIVLERS